MSIRYLSSESVAFRHGFFTRNGGVSTDQFQSLNVTERVGDTASNVAENKKRALAALQLKPENLAYLDNMEHSDRILAVSPAAKGVEFDGYDAIMTNQAEVIIGMSVADCPVVLLSSEKDGVIALAHSGWRGTKADISLKVVEAMSEEYGVHPGDIRAVVGPGIAVESYEIGDDVVRQFDSRYIANHNGQTHLDLNMAIEDQLIEAGIGSIDNLKVDTFTDKRFFSYRRDNGDTGRFFVVASL